MRLADIRLLAASRKGDLRARCEIGRRYLLGVDGFHRHVATGIEYLTHPSVRELDQASTLIAECLPLEDLISFRQEQALQRAACVGSPIAQVKLAMRLCTRLGRAATALRWFEAAAAKGHRAAVAAVAAMKQPNHVDSVLSIFKAASHGEADGLAVSLICAKEALDEKDVPSLVRALEVALALVQCLTPTLAELIVSLVRLVEESRLHCVGIGVHCIEKSLETQAIRGDSYAAYALGRALCGLDCGCLPAKDLAETTNLRKGAAFLLRAADGGISDAWLRLYKLHAEHQSSVSNPQMARFFLEKAAAEGKAEAQRKLGAIQMRQASSIQQAEAAVELLALAAQSGDRHAHRLLCTLVLPLEGSDDDAKSGIDQVAREDPGLAVRLQLSRNFGLTKLEALTVNPADGIRPWGLLVGRNPFITQCRRAAPRAVPARSETIMDNLRRAADFFDRGSPGLRLEGDLRRRSAEQRRAFERHRLDEAVFFASATSSTLESLRQGPKWAFRASDCLRGALAD